MGIVKNHDRPGASLMPGKWAVSLRKSGKNHDCRGLIFALFFYFALLVPAGAVLIETAARQAILVDLSSGAVLYAKQPDQLVSPASMSKLMTMYVAFDALRSGRLRLGDKLPVSKRAWRFGGSKMFVALGDDIPVEELLRGIAVQSGNDACIVLAEGISGSEEAFVNEMNRLAEEIGLTNSVFHNATGWPHPKHRMSVRDISALATRIITEFPKYYGYFSEREFTWSKIRQVNRNHLLFVDDLQVDGLKTGHTEESGYSIVASAIEGDRRLIAVVTGLGSEKVRSNEAKRLLRWGFRQFRTIRLFEKDEIVTHAQLWTGTENTIPLKLAAPLYISLPRGEEESLQVTVIHDSHIPAPVKSDVPQGMIRIAAKGMETVTRPLFTARAVEKAGFGGRLQSAFLALFYTLFH